MKWLVPVGAASGRVPLCPGYERVRSNSGEKDMTGPAEDTLWRFPGDTESMTVVKTFVWTEDGEEEWFVTMDFPDGIRRTFVELVYFDPKEVDCLEYVHP